MMPEKLSEKVAKLEEQLDKYKAAVVMSVSAKCAKFHFQNCGVCERMECSDNTSPAKRMLMDLQAKLDEKKLALEQEIRDGVERQEALENTMRDKMAILRKNRELELAILQSVTGDELKAIAEKHSIQGAGRATDLQRLERYKRRTEKWKACLFHILGCGSNGRVLQEVTRLKAQEYDEVGRDVTPVMVNQPPIPDPIGDDIQRHQFGDLKSACRKLGPWMSAALDDEKVCAEMKRDIEEWFAAQPWMYLHFDEGDMGDADVD